MPDLNLPNSSFPNSQNAPNDVSGNGGQSTSARTQRFSAPKVLIV